MRKLFLTFTLLLCALPLCAQPALLSPDLNFGFEKNGEELIQKWDDFGSPEYLISLDSLNCNSGKYSALIEHNSGNKSDFKALAFTLPENYEGKEITLSGYIKTENVTNGFAGLWMRIDPNVAFDNMYDRGVTGTTDWTKYEITLSMDPEKTQQIVFGGMLVGKGKMWLDDLSLSIDGYDISDAVPYIKELLPAQKDNEFDEGSNIIFPALDNKTIETLELLGKIWGFLKYHHPEVAKGNYNWDYELFRILPDYLNTGNIKDRDLVLRNWINKFEIVSSEKTTGYTNDNAFITPDHKWIENSDMSSELKAMLKDIYDNRNQGDNFYVGLYPGIGNPEFNNEHPYSNQPYPDAGFRLLSLFRYWNIIHYFYPYKHITDKDWNEVLKEYIPLFILAKDELEYEIVTLKIINEICDTHANLWGGGDKIDNLRGSNYAPFRVQFIENKLVITDHYNPELISTDEFPIGTIITKIDGKSIDMIVDSLRTYYPASNEPTRLRDMSADLLRSSNNTIQVDYISAGKEVRAKLTLYKKDDLNIYRWYKESENCYELLDDNIGYINLSSIQAEDISNIRREFQNTSGIIIDIRNYPSTFVVFTLGSYFVSQATPFVKLTIGNINTPGEFNFGKSLKVPKSRDTYQGKLVVIVNEYTQSQAEYTAMAFRAGDDTTIVGSVTAGADGNVSTIFLPGGMRTMISGIGVYYPDGTETQRVGIIPDIKIEPTVEGIKSDRDELLEKAIELIRNN